MVVFGIPSDESMGNSFGASGGSSLACLEESQSDPPARGVLPSGKARQGRVGTEEEEDDRSGTTTNSLQGQMDDTTPPAETEVDDKDRRAPEDEEVTMGEPPEGRAGLCTERTKRQLTDGA